MAPSSRSSVVRGGAGPLAAAGSLGVLFAAIGFVGRIPAVVGAELGVDQFLAAHERTPALTGFVLGVADTAVPSRVGLVAIVLVPAAFLLARRRGAALRALGVLAGAMTAATVIKRLVDQPRPPAALWAVPAHGASFPSGHTTTATAVVVAVLLGLAGVWRVLTCVVGTAWVSAVGFSRLYLAHHFLHDVLGAVVLVVATGFLVVAVSTAVRRSAAAARAAPF